LYTNVSDKYAASIFRAEVRKVRNEVLHRFKSRIRPRTLAKKTQETGRE
jgi:hypothetical protein